MSQTSSLLPADDDPDCAVIQIKILFWGPGESGKTTTYHRLMEIFTNFQVGRGLSVETTDHRTMWADSAHFRFVLIPKKVHIVLLIATTTGQERFLHTREYVSGTDGVIFCADSCLDKMKENLRSYEELQHFLARRGVPMLVQLNKRDLTQAVPLKDFIQLLDLPVGNKGPKGAPIVYETVAESAAVEDHRAVQQMVLTLLERIIRQKIRLR